MTRQILFGLLVLGGWVTGRAPVSIEPIQFRLVAVEDSSSYLVYRYTARNSATSTQGVAAIRLDVSAAVGTGGEALPATGYFFNGAAVVSSVPVTMHAPVGPISPANCEAYLERSAVLMWNGANGDMYDNDSIPPGGSLTGLGVRSPYLPGIRQIGGVPTWQSCCMTPLGTEEENPLRMLPKREDFMVFSNALGPEFTPSEITIGLLQSQVDTICTDPLWLNDSRLCSEFSSMLSDAQSSLILGEAYGAAAKLADLRDRVDVEQAPDGARGVLAPASQCSAGAPEFGSTI